jgi:hypothetical protein
MKVRQHHVRCALQHFLPGLGKFIDHPHAMSVPFERVPDGLGHIGVILNHQHIKTDLFHVHHPSPTVSFVLVTIDWSVGAGSKARLDLG